MNTWRSRVLAVAIDVVTVQERDLGCGWWTEATLQRSSVDTINNIFNKLVFVISMWILNDIHVLYYVQYDIHV